MIPFEPLFPNPDVLTILGNFWPRTLDTARFPEQETLCATEPGVQVLVKSQRPPGEPKGQLLLVHGLEGSSDGGYMRSLAHAALGRGYAAHRFNIRGCGGTERLANTLYHSGLTGDLRFVLDRLRREAPVLLVGFSLGGNMSLKLAGELGEQGPELLAGVCAVSAPIDLLASVRRIGEPRNWLYERRFVRRMQQRLRVRHGHMPERFPTAGLDRIRTVFEFDDRFTAPHFGFRDAVHYYTTQSSNQYLERIRVPTLLIWAKDDPMIPSSVYDHPAVRSNPCIRAIPVGHGGHLGFLARRGPRFWVDHVILDWAAPVLAAAKAGTKPAPFASSE